MKRCYLLCSIGLQDIIKPAKKYNILAGLTGVIMSPIYSILNGCV